MSVHINAEVSEEGDSDGECCCGLPQSGTMRVTLPFCCASIAVVCSGDSPDRHEALHFLLPHQVRSSVEF